MDPFHLVILPAVRDAMLAHARAELPNECVGFLSGTIADGTGTVAQCLPLVNELAGPTRSDLWRWEDDGGYLSPRYEVIGTIEFYTQPHSVLAAYRAMRETGTDVLAVYHSHPTSAPIPSKKDIARNTYGPDVAWVIIGLAGDEPEVRAWWLSESGYREAL